MNKEQTKPKEFKLKTLHRAKTTTKKDTIIA